LLKEAN